MINLVFDTETTGFYHDNLPQKDPYQPKIVQIGALLADDRGDILGELDLIVNPGIDIPEAAERVHGIPTALAQQVGVDSSTALDILLSWVLKADQVIAHNGSYDWRVLRSELLRRPVVSLYDTEDEDELRKQLARPNKICTMRTACRIVNIPPTPKMKRAGRKHPKNPKLDTEAYPFFFGEELANAHKAIADARATLRLYLELVRRGVRMISWEEPEDNTPWKPSE